MRLFVHKDVLEHLQRIATKGGGFQRVEFMVIEKDLELMVPSAEERKWWVEVKLSKEDEDV